MKKFINFKVFSVCVSSDNALVFDVISKDCFLDVVPTSEVLLTITLSGKADGLGKISGSAFRQVIRGFGRACEVYYNYSDGKIEALLILPECSNAVDRFLSSSFSDRFEMVINDFFHGAYLGLLSIIAIKRGALLIHSSCVNIRGCSHVFIGDAQSGKTTLVDSLSAVFGFPVVSEDMLILTQCGTIFPLQTRVRVSIERYKKFQYNPGFAERLNLFLFKCLNAVGIKAGHRRIMFDDFFESTASKGEAEVKLYYLKRSQSGMDIAGHEFAFSIIMSELENMGSLLNVVNWLEERGYFPDSSFQEFFSQNYINHLGAFGVENLFIPFFERRSDFVQYISTDFLRSLM